mmetsp:Transcript_7709/g.24494  ORF Transcript_7709/g.24494 Transcript_7709/m.24494 type:complete len:213 (-) Transcript_7709:287-925(-)
MTMQHAASSSSHGPPTKWEMLGSKASPASRSSAVRAATAKAARLYESVGLWRVILRVRLTAMTPSSPSSGCVGLRSVNVTGACSARTARRILAASASSGKSVPASGPSRETCNWRPCISKAQLSSSRRAKVWRSSRSSIRKRTVRTVLVMTRTIRNSPRIQCRCPTPSRRAAGSVASCRRSRPLKPLCDPISEPSAMSSATLLPVYKTSSSM